jgi:branched-chain amino acid transport system substrate-binding protein
VRLVIPRAISKDAFAFIGYSNATLFAKVPRRCSDNPTREHWGEMTAHLRGVQLPALLPGVTASTSPMNYAPIKQMRLQRFDGRSWVFLADVYEE